MKEESAVTFPDLTKSNGRSQAMANKQELVTFLESRVFDPILRASAHDYKQADQDKLANVKRRTESERERFHKYPSAGDLVENYKRDLHSDAAKKVNRELDALKLPTLPSVRDEFLKLAGDS